MSTRKKREDHAENQGDAYTCQNPLCRKTFASPIKVENVSSKPHVTYEACPYCLTQIVVEETVPVPKEQKTTPAKGKIEAQIETEQLEKIKKPEQQLNDADETEGCKHYFGYLSKRSTKEGTPEECMLCEKVVQCMLKSVSE
ncbi:MAG: hypothetical protein QXJ94_05360 [Candidatus Bathyarchaeia archaeon]